MNLGNEMSTQMKSFQGEQKEIQVELAETNKRTWCMRSARGDRHVTLFEVENLADTDNSIFSIELIADF
jgi:hypothetical protein